MVPRPPENRTGWAPIRRPGHDWREQPHAKEAAAHSARDTHARTTRRSGVRRRVVAYFSWSATAAEGARRPEMRGECGVVEGEGE
uniref:Uncharacterized protein n=1 Tax=Arundo donax TaxID=35708 RepID=A0A0A9DPP3_ARUDO